MNDAGFQVVLLQPLETDDRFTVECNEGYELVGPGGPLVCYKDDIYSRHLPACQKKNLNSTACFEPYVQNGNIVPKGAPFTGYYVTVRISSCLLHSECVIHANYSI